MLKSPWSLVLASVTFRVVVVSGPAEPGHPRPRDSRVGVELIQGLRDRDEPVGRALDRRHDRGPRLGQLLHLAVLQGGGERDRVDVPAERALDGAHPAETGDVVLDHLQVYLRGGGVPLHGLGQVRARVPGKLGRLHVPDLVLRGDKVHVADLGAEISCSAASVPPRG